MRFTLALIPALLLAACAPEADKAATGPAAMDHSRNDMSAATPAALTEAQAAYKAANDRMHADMTEISADPDLAFMQGMLAHHRGAVAMSEVALKYAKDAKARDFAARVIAAQKAEISEMEAWLAAHKAQ